MSTTMVASEMKAVPPVVSSIQDIPLEKIRESKTNPRTQFDQSKLAELAVFVPRNKCSICGANQFERIRSTVAGLTHIIREN